MAASNKHDACDKALALEPPYGPAELWTLFEAWRNVLLGLTTTDAERGVITEELRGWEARPALSRLLDLLERRVTDEDDREIVRRGRAFRRRLPEPPFEPPPDPILEDLIMKQAARRVEAEAVAEVSLDKLVGVHVKLRKATTQAEIERLQAEERIAIAEREDAVRAADREASRLAQLLQQRANRHRMFLIAESTK